MITRRYFLAIYIIVQSTSTKTTYTYIAIIVLANHFTPLWLHSVGANSNKAHQHVTRFKNSQVEIKLLAWGTIAFSGKFMKGFIFKTFKHF